MNPSSNLPSNPSSRAALLITAFLAALAMPLVASAQAVSVYGGAALVYSPNYSGPGTDDQLELQPYIEAELNGFYGGIWLSFAKQEVYDEVDLYIGYRNQTARGLSYDVNYTRYIYPNAGQDCCGEFGLTLGTAASDNLALYIDAFYDPEASNAAVDIGGEYLVTDNIGISAEIGSIKNGGAQEWEFGSTYYINDTTSADLHYYDGSEYKGYVSLSLSFDTTLFGG